MTYVSLRLLVLFVALGIMAGYPAFGVSPSPAFASPEGIVVESLKLTDMAGNGQMKRIRPDGQFMMTLAITNAADRVQEYVVVYEVRDANGFTVLISVVEGVLNPGEKTRVGAPVSLEELGEYTTRAFAYSFPVIAPSRDSIVVSPIVAAPISVAEIEYTHQTGVVIPLYEYPYSNSPGMWNVISQQKMQNPGVPFATVINPWSGPGLWQDPNYVRATAELRDSGVEYVLGYISTDYARQTSGSTIGDIKAMIDKYREWYPDVNGILLDEVNSSASRLDFYTEIVAYTRSAGIEYVFANPGTKIAEEYVDLFDKLIIYENRVLPSASELQENTYFPRYSPEKFAFAVKNVANLDVGYVDEIRDYVGLLYMTNDIESASDPNPYNTLPHYFADLIRFLAPCC